MSNYNNLPGVNINVKDGQMLITDDNTSNSMLIIGEVKAGESIQIPDEPMLVRTEDDLFENFGRYFHRGELNPIAAEWKVAKDANIRNTYLLGLVGNTEKERFIYLQDMMFNIIADYEFSHIVVAGMYADENIEGITPEDFKVSDLNEVAGLNAYYTIKGKIDAEELVLNLGESKTFTAKVGSEGQDLTATITSTIQDPRDLANHLTVELRKAISEAGLNLYLSIEVVGGKTIIKSTEEVVLEGEEVLTALGVTAEDTPALEGYGNVASLLGSFAEQQTLSSSTVIVYIGTKPVKTTNKKEIKESVDRLVKRNNDISKHVQVIAGPEVGVSIPGSLRTQWLSGVTNYAVLVNSIAVQNSTTNQPLPEISGLRYDLSLRQLNDLVGNKYVTFRSKNNRIVVVDGITSAPDIYKGQDVVHSDFRRLTTLRSTSYMVNGIREVVDPFIGRPNEFPSYNAMNTAIRGFINKAIDRGVIQDAVYSINMGENLDVANINLTILPQFELRRINVEIGLSTPQGFQTINK